MLFSRCARWGDHVRQHWEEQGDEEEGIGEDDIERICGGQMRGGRGERICEGAGERRGRRSGDMR